MKKPMSASVEEHLIEAVDKTFSNRSDAVRKGLYRVVMDSDILENALEEVKEERDHAISKKQEWERRAERKRDEIREIERAVDRARTMEKAKSLVDDKIRNKIESMFSDWRSEWRKGDPRAPSKKQIIERQAERVAKDASGIKVEHVKTVLMAEFNV